jgi:hypothetical protein
MTRAEASRHGPWEPCVFDKELDGYCIVVKASGDVHVCASIATIARKSAGGASLEWHPSGLER